MMKKLNFNSEEESALVQEVYNNALESLADEDKTLPQVLQIHQKSSLLECDHRKAAFKFPWV